MPRRLESPYADKPVDDAEIDRLGDPAHRFVDGRLVDVEDPRCHGLVNVEVVREGPAQGRIVGIMREDPQLDLRIIGRQELPAGLARDERLADLAAVLGAHRDILQVGVARAQPPGRGDALVERGVNPAVVGMHEPGQRVQVRALELRELAMLQEQGGKRVLEGQLFQNVLGRALLAAGRLLQRGQFQLVEEHLAKLGPRVDVEGPAGQRDTPRSRSRRSARRIRATVA